MEALSVASAAANLLSLCVHIAGCLYRKWNDDSRPGSDRLLYEVSRLRNVLENIEIASSTEQAIVADGLRKEFDDTQKTLLNLLKSLNRDLHCKWLWEPYLPSRPGAELPLSKQDLDTSARLLSTHFSEIRKNVQKVPSFRIAHVATSLPANDTRFSNSLWYGKADYESAHNYAQSVHVKGTGVWLLNNKQFKVWLMTQHKPNVLYCSGGPGTGKTILTSAVINHISERRTQSSDNAVAYFYFNYNIATSILGVAIALLEQLYRQSPTLAEEVLQLQQNAEVGPVNLRDVMPVLLAVARRFGKCFIVLDALDECAPEHKSDLATFLEFLNTSGCRLLVTSRLQAPLEFKNCEDIKVDPDESDIRLMIVEQLRNSPTLPDFIKESESLQTDIEDQIMRNCSRMFLLASRLCQSMTGAKTRSEVEDRLHTLSGLKDIYDRDMECVVKHEALQKSLALTTLTWLYYAQRPLTTAEIVDICQRTAARIKSQIEVKLSLILSVCIHFVRLEPISDTVVFTHLTVREYLESRLRETSLLGTEEEIAEACLEILQPQDGRNISSPVRAYAAMFWGRHLQQDQAPSTVVQKMVKNYLSDTGNALQSTTKWLLATEAAVGRNVATEMPEHKTTALHVAAYFGLSWAFDLTFQNMAMLDRPDSLDRTALHIATSQSSKACVLWLLKRGADCQIKDQNEQNAFHHAAQYGSPGIMEVLVDHILRHRTFFKDPIDRNTKDYALGFSDRDSLQPIMAIDIQGKTPVDYAAGRGVVDNLKYLLRLLSTKQTSRPNLDSSVHWALFYNQFDCLKLLVQSELDIAVTPGNMTTAAALGFEDAVRLFLDIGIDINAPSNDEEMAIHTAASAGKRAILRLLIMAGADLEVRDGRGLTPLARAIMVNDAGAVRDLIEGGASVTVKTSEGETMLEYASGNRYTEIVAILTDSGARIDDRIPVDADLEGYNETMDGFELADGAGQLVSKLITSIPTSVEEHAKMDPGLLTQRTMSSDTAPVHQLPLYSITPDSLGSNLGGSPSSGHGVYAMDEVNSFEHERNSRLVEKGSGLTGLAAAPFIVLHEPFSPDLLPLGTIVRDSHSPLASYFPQDPYAIWSMVKPYISVSEKSNFSFHRETSSSRGASVRALFASISSQTQNKKALSIDAEKCTRETLTNHAQVLGLIVAKHKAAIIDLFDTNKKAYVIVGRMILENTRSATMTGKSDESTSVISLDAIGAVPGLSLEAPKPKIEFRSMTETTSHDASVYALQYAQLRVKRAFLNRERTFYTDGYAKGPKYDDNALL